MSAGFGEVANGADLMIFVRQLEDDRPDSRMPFPVGKDPVLTAKTAACTALARIGINQKTPEERIALANKYPVFTTLQPFLSSSNEDLADACRKALAWYSASQDFPFVLQLLRSVTSFKSAVPVG